MRDAPYYRFGARRKFWTAAAKRSDDGALDSAKPLVC
jgi:hypothetical protein